MTRHDPPTAPVVYLAEAMDRAKGSSPDGYRIARELADTGCTVYRPATTWTGGQHHPRMVEGINRQVLRGADCLVADLRGSIYSIGVPAEIEAATAREIAAVVITDPDMPPSVVLRANPLVLFAAHNTEAVAMASDLAHIHRKAGATGPEPLRFTVAAGAEPPQMAFADDAGLDLVTAVDTEVPPGTFVDIPTTITGVQCPRGTWLLITGRSSTVRKRGLLVPNGIIDHGWRGPLMAGAYNLTAETVVVRAGERVAQAILHHSVTEQHPVRVVTELEPHSRGLAGFGSSGA